MNVCDQFPPVVGTLASVVTEEHGDRVHGEHAEVGAASEALHRGGSGQVLQLVFIGYSTLKSMTLPFFLRNLQGNNQKQLILDIFLRDIITFFMQRKHVSLLGSCFVVLNHLHLKDL